MKVEAFLYMPNASHHFNAEPNTQHTYVTTTHTTPLPLHRHTNTLGPCIAPHLQTPTQTFWMNRVFRAISIGERRTQHGFTSASFPSWLAGWLTGWMDCAGVHSYCSHPLRLLYSFVRSYTRRERWLCVWKDYSNMYSVRVNKMCIQTHSVAVYAANAEE